MSTRERREERMALKEDLKQRVGQKLGLPLLEVELMQVTVRGGRLTKVHFRSKVIPTDGSPEGADVITP